MFCKKEIKELSEKVEKLSDKLWKLENPHGYIHKEFDFFISLIYKPSRKENIRLCGYYSNYETAIKYKIKESDKCVYIVVDFKTNVNNDIKSRTFAIKDNVCIEINNPIDLSDFDEEVNI